jgi:hypothetical protein
MAFHLGGGYPQIPKSTTTTTETTSVRMSRKLRRQILSTLYNNEEDFSQGGGNAAITEFEKFLQCSTTNAPDKPKHGKAASLSQISVDQH